MVATIHERILQQVERNELCRSSNNVVKNELSVLQREVSEVVATFAKVEEVRDAVNQLNQGKPSSGRSVARTLTTIRLMEEELYKRVLAHVPTLQLHLSYNAVVQQEFSSVNVAMDDVVATVGKLEEVPQHTPQIRLARTSCHLLKLQTYRSSRPPRVHSADATEHVQRLVDSAVFDNIGMSEQNPRCVVYFSDSIMQDDRAIAQAVKQTRFVLVSHAISYFTITWKFNANKLNQPCCTLIQPLKLSVRVTRFTSLVILTKLGTFFQLRTFARPDAKLLIFMLKIAILATYQEAFAPEFCMMDADKAQFSACTTELPTTEIMMCFYHVMDYVFKQTRIRGVEPKQSASFFADMYDLHFAHRTEFDTLKTTIILKWENLPVGSAAGGMAQYIMSSWISNPRFSKWQAFYTPPGYPTTNNPLEQYHRPLKRFCRNLKAVPKELLESMNVARIAILAEERVFTSQTEVAVRLFKLYKQLEAHQCITATRFSSVGGVTSSKYCVLQLPLPLPANDRKERLQSIASVNARRLQRVGMPNSGWQVDMELVVCGCLYYAKHDMCLQMPECRFLV
ncbi:Hypothetical protein PHPALM_17070 [Phytophthora palmivora]|uniref:MULE transposase domain-containing protein n=1 Tax=Phytophthora palmivora TaxID=4796 RepID=A0A2P4XN61_9STRA|nr:Hypothetical protein PHPALM_17070 [Phytophthora palmivora]